LEVIQQQPIQTPIKPVLVVEVPKENEAEREAKELETMEATFRQSVAEYCNLRNAQAKKLDVLRELRAEAEQCASVADDGNFILFSF